MDFKLLTPLAWRTFAKGRTYADKTLLTGLVEFQDVRNEDPEEQLVALKQIGAALAVLAREHKTDEPLADRIKAMSAEIARARTLAQEELRAAPALPPMPPLLGDKLLPLLREVRRGVAMQVLVARGGRGAALMLSRRTIPPVMRTLLRNYLGASSVKYLTGRCVFENGVHTFVLTPQVSGIDRRIRAAILLQTGLRLKLAVRAETAA